MVYYNLGPLFKPSPIIRANDFLFSQKNEEIKTGYVNASSRRLSFSLIIME
jgi:hypothetical protein